MMEERYHATTQNRFCPDMSNVNKILQWRQNLSVLNDKQFTSNTSYFLLCGGLHVSVLNDYRQAVL